MSNLVKKKLTEQTIREDREKFNELRPIASIGQERDFLRDLGYTEAQIKGKWDYEYNAHEHTKISDGLVSTIKQQTGINIKQNQNRVPMYKINFIHSLRSLMSITDAVDFHTMYLTGSQIYDIKNLIGKLEKKIKETEGGSNG